MMKTKHYVVGLMWMMASACLADVTIMYRTTVLDVTDGDTIIVSNKVMRDGTTLRSDRPVELDAVASPDLDQPGGAEAKQYLADLVKGKIVEVVELTDMGRSRGAWVFLGDQCVNVSLVQYGLAWLKEARVYSYRRGAETNLPPAFAKAKTEKLGIWAHGPPIPPWEWRRSQETNAANQAAQATARKFADPGR